MRTLSRRATVAAAVGALSLVGASATAGAQPTASTSVGTQSVGALESAITVTVTVTGADDVVIYDDEVETTGHVVTPLYETAHLCDGTNNNANSTAGATPTAALDDSGLDWDGFWYSSFEDYLVTEIDGVVQSSSEFWEISVNGSGLSVGGCQYLLSEGDEVAFTLTEF